MVIFGGGIAGLWTLARLNARGYACALVERAGRPVGGVQTLASQGIIHGGVKYALTGAASRASRAIAAMPELWGACLRGEGPAGEPDLRGARVLSPSQNLWTTGSVGSKLVALAASKAIRTPVRRLDDAQRRAWLDATSRGAAEPGRVDVYEVDEPVLDPRSVVEALLAGRHALVGQYSRAAWTGAGVEVVEAASGACITAGAAVLCAGEGNAALLAALDGENGGVGPPDVQQLRPLHMVYARGDLPEVFGHALSGVTSADKPRLTITSQRDSAGRTVWAVGGQIAESGVDVDAAEQVDRARRELAACVGWALPRSIELATHRWQRAEGAEPNRARPEGPVVRTAGADGRRIAVWPTKLAFAPETARLVDDALASAGVSPSGRAFAARGQGSFGRVPVAPLPWESSAMEWTP